MAKSKQPSTAPRTTTITPTSLASTITAFSPAPSPSAAPAFYAHLHRAPDAHTLRVYEVSSGKCVSRWSSAGSDDDEREQVGAIEWAVLPSKEQADEQEEGDSSKRGKKRRKSDTQHDAIAAKAAATEPNKLVLSLGLASGKIILWSPNGSTAAPTILSHSSCTSPVTAISFPEVSAAASSARHLWTAHDDGFVRAWDLASSSLVAQAMTGEAGKGLDSIAVRYPPTGADKQPVQLLAARLSVSVYAFNLSQPKKDKVKELKPVEIGRATGHVEKAFVRWVAFPADDSAVAAEDEPTRFVSFSPSDRFVQLWQFTPSTARSDAVLLARLAVDSGVAAVALSATAGLAALDVSGSLSLTTIPASFESSPSSSKKGRKSSGIATLEPTTELVGRAGEGAGIAQAALAGSSVIVCRGGVKPVFESVAFEVEGQTIPRVELDKVGSALSQGVADETAGVPAPTRYVEPAAAAQRTGDAVAELGSDDELANEGELDVDLAEPTLADRLKSLNMAKKANQADKGEASDEDISDDEDDSDDDEEDLEDDDDVDAVGGGAIPATTLTTTLLQSLHSSDAPLLESCLAHTNPTLIRATVKRIPSGGLVLALLEALVERLGRAKGGKQGTASVRRSRGLVEWVRQVLVVHVGFLVTIPSLVTRLSALHASLTSRLALQPTLLALDGRLQLVMSQMELRREQTAARAPAITTGKSRGGKVYREGESSDSGSDDGEDSDGSIEDVVLGSASEDEDEGSELSFDDEDLEDLSGESSDGEGLAPKSRQDNGRGAIDLLELEASESDGTEDEDLSEGEEESE